MVEPIPADYRAVTPYLIVRDAQRALDFYARAFGAQELLRLPMPGGRIGHAEIRIGAGIVMLADEMPDMGYLAPNSLGGTPVSLMFYVPDVDARFEKAIAAGAQVRRAVQNQFYGDRSGVLADPFGHVWTIATHVEDVSAEEMDRRMQAFAAGGGAS